MKLLALTLAAFLACSAPAFALCDDWSRQDTVLEAAGQALLAVDWAQTRAAVADPNRQEYNSIIGAHADPAWINRYFAEAALGHLLLSCALPPEPRALWQSFGIGLEFGIVLSNKASGATFSARW